MERAEPIDVTRALQAGERAAEAKRMRARLLEQGLAQSATDARWYVLRVTKRDEKAVEKSLVDAGIDAWLPTYRAAPTYRRGRYIPARDAAALPGYLFVKVASNAEIWAWMGGFEGVIAVLGTACAPVPVSDEDLSKVRNLCAIGRVKDAAKKRRPEPGDWVYIASGPMMGHQGTVTGVHKRREDRIMVQLFPGFAPVELPLAHLSESD